MRMVQILAPLALAGAALATDREQWVKDQLAKTQAEYPDKNIFIYHANKGDFAWSTSNHVIKNTQDYIFPNDNSFSNEQYRTIVFEGPGELENKGDGGFLNWAFAGNYDRDGMKVHFH